MYGQRVAVRQGQYSFAQARQPDSGFLQYKKLKVPGRSGCRADGKAFAGSCRGVTQRIQGIRAFAHGLAQSAHFSVSARVVGYGAVSSVAKVMPKVESMPTAAMPMP